MMTAPASNLGYLQLLHLGETGIILPNHKTVFTFAQKFSKSKRFCYIFVLQKILS